MWRQSTAVAALCLVGAGCSSSPTPPALPPLPAAAFPGAVREQILHAYDSAAARPMDGFASGRLGMVLHAYSENALAEICYQRARVLDPGVFEWSYYQGVLRLERGNTAGAAEAFSAALRIRSGDPSARLKLAAALLASHSLKRSRKLYEAVLAGDPDLAQAHAGLAAVLHAEGDAKGRIQHLETACELAPHFGPAHFELASAYRSAGDAGRAAAELERYRRDPAGAPTDHYLASVMALNRSSLYREQIADQLIARGRAAEAATLLEEVVAGDPKNEPARVNLVVAYWQLGKWDLAEAHYRTAVQLNPATRAHTAFGLVELERKRYAEAERSFARALAISPRDAAANTQMGRVMEATGRRREALARYRQALETDPKSRAANYLLGMALLESGDAAGSVTHLEKTLDPVDEKTPGYLRALATAYARAGRPEESAATNERARKLALISSQGQLAAEISSELQR